MYLNSEGLSQDRRQFFSVCCLFCDKRNSGKIQELGPTIFLKELRRKDCFLLSFLWENEVCEFLFCARLSALWQIKGSFMRRSERKLFLTAVFSPRLERGGMMWQKTWLFWRSEVISSPNFFSLPNQLSRFFIDCQERTKTQPTLILFYDRVIFVLHLFCKVLYKVSSLGRYFLPVSWDKLKLFFFWRLFGGALCVAKKGGGRRRPSLLPFPPPLFFFFPSACHVTFPWESQVTRVFTPTRAIFLGNV